ncbi:hypothetical protein ACIOKD_31815 [Streptomyces sp. NPDC087844]|uniref:hypothetical protein n=1 Tax=Streptomyces sp. NPDC087844 TaxID=3365805 RepID=UPI003808765C
MRLMPNPDCLLRALEHLGAQPKDAVLVGSSVAVLVGSSVAVLVGSSVAVLVGSSVAELTAARAAGLRFLGYTRSEGHNQRLARAGCEVTTASWAPSSGPSSGPSPTPEPPPAPGAPARHLTSRPPPAARRPPPAAHENHPSSRTPPGLSRKATPRQLPHDA